MLLYTQQFKIVNFRVVYTCRLYLLCISCLCIFFILYRLYYSL